MGSEPNLQSASLPSGYTVAVCGDAKAFGGHHVVVRIERGVVSLEWREVVSIHGSGVRGPTQIEDEILMRSGSAPTAWEREDLLEVRELVSALLDAWALACSLLEFERDEEAV